MLDFKKLKIFLKIFFPKSSIPERTEMMKIDCIETMENFLTKS